MTDLRRRVPRTDAVLADPRLAEAERILGRSTVKSAVAAAQRRARAGEIPPEEVVAAAVAALPATAASLRPVINATGVLVHTNLGRAPLSRAAREAVAAAAGACDVEFDLASGERARRGRGALAALAEAVPEAAAVHVVNNNAAALLLCALALAGDGGEIVVSRGEMVEIGDGFRLPDLLTGAGAVLREVGTTNRTTVDDYAAAVTTRTAFVLRVHPSNFRITGFTSAPETAELAGLGVPLVVDVGSGQLTPDPLLPREPDVTSALRSGAALVTASGDKLLGGPQCGLLFGAADLVERLRRHPTARALRVDKLTLAALEATLRGPAPPVRARLETPVAELSARAAALATRFRRAGLDARAERSQAAVGGGGAPGVELPSAAVSLPAAFAAPLRASRPVPVVGRVRRSRCLLDLRTVAPAEEEDLAAAVLAAGRHLAPVSVSPVAVDGSA
ncbi:L-seryl-tRNA(Sec) selenium transferase [Marinactinospora thermotolerans]|uniref:L-seryl-tRNA(Sec) selenium transferase n=1 Tax=Marinactinospora thermotolerans DSM 45154 TaxID=1122192 RepID=A0A1T4TB06_9ACTN|nr:L-seryl-tRNA(Sec) selenium transferase [Marinactinospora thermotolerans]SKA37368.1 L-seryl-tRNA(Sec) selenium transferase [Marinactinospora thermotolerans DSM 45154]